MKTAPTIQPPATPSALDNVLMQINTSLLSDVTWLNNAFGKAQELIVKNDRGRKIRYPGIYTGDAAGIPLDTNREYANVFPHEGYNNFSFWQISDYEIDWIPNQTSIITVDFGLIFWFNVQTILAQDERRNLELLKEDVYNFFTEYRLTHTRITPQKMSEKNETIYREYDITEIEDQYLMHPFAGFRLEGQLEYMPVCFSEGTN